MMRKEESESVKRSQQLRDKSRNEQQKSMLLKASYLLRQERTARELCENSKRILERSQELRDESARLKAGKKKAI